MGATASQSPQPNDLDALLRAANNILTFTPDPQWWSKSPVEVIEFAFPEWRIVGHRSNESRPHSRTPRCLLRHRHHPDRWLLIYAIGNELLPGRGSTMGQFFRFATGYGKNTFVLGTAEQVLREVHRQLRHGGSEVINWWILDRLMVEAPEAVETLDDSTCARWRLFTLAEQRSRNLLAACEEQPSPRTILSEAFAEFELIGLFDEDETYKRPRALLRHREHPDLWLGLIRRFDRALFEVHDASGGPVFNAGPLFRREDTPMGLHTHLLGSTEDLVNWCQPEHGLQQEATDKALMVRWWFLSGLVQPRPDLDQSERLAQTLQTEITLRHLADDDPIIADALHGIRVSFPDVLSA